jgi:hypothetical protein
MVLRKIKWNCVDWIDQTRDRDQWSALVNTTINLRVLQNLGNLLAECLLASRRTLLHGVS